MDVLVWGGTHKFEAYELEGKLFVNPGTATGAISSGWWAEEDEPVASFCLMDVSFGRGRPGRIGIRANEWNFGDKGPGPSTGSLRLPAANRREWRGVGDCGEGDVQEGDAGAAVKGKVIA